MGIESVGLEHHCDVAILRSDVVDDTLADTDFASRNLFQSGDHTQQRRFSAAGGPDENNEFAVRDLEVDGRQDAK